MALMFTCVAVEFLRVLLGHLFRNGKLFFLYPGPGAGALEQVALYGTTVACVALPLKIWNNTRNELKLEDQQRLSNMRYRGGVTAYLEVLDTDRQLFDAQLGLAQARRNEILALVALYRALGGGWVDTAPQAPPVPDATVEN